MTEPTIGELAREAERITKAFWETWWHDLLEHMKKVKKEIEKEESDD